MDLHSVVGNESVATLQQLNGGLGFADTAVADQQNTFAVNFHQNAVAGDTGSQGVLQIGDDGGTDGTGGLRA